MYVIAQTWSIGFINDQVVPIRTIDVFAFSRDSITIFNTRTQNNIQESLDTHVVFISQYISCDEKNDCISFDSILFYYLLIITFFIADKIRFCFIRKIQRHQLFVCATLLTWCHCCQFCKP